MVFGRLVILLALGAALSACGKTGEQLASANMPTPDKPGTNVKFQNPNPNKWVVTQNRQTAPGLWATVYACKPLACAGAAGVGIQGTPSPTRTPDRTALEKSAKLLPTQAKADDLMAEAASGGDERVSFITSGVTEVRGYPAILAETKRTTRGKARYLLQGNLFVGSLLMKVWSVSTTREEAKRNFDEFIAVMEVVDIEAPLPAANGGASAPPQNAMAPRF